MNNSSKICLLFGILMPIMLYEYVELYGVTPKFILGMFLIGVLLSAYRYFIIKEVLNNKHEVLVDFIQKRIDKENGENDEL